MNANKIGVAVLIATLVAYAFAGLERQLALKEADLDAQEIAAGKADLTRYNAIIKATRDSAEEAHNFELAFAAAGKPGYDAEDFLRREQAAKEANELKTKAEAAKDEKRREDQQAAEKEDHRAALAAIDRTSYEHFALVWLLTTGVLLALSSLEAGSRTPPPVPITATPAPPTSAVTVPEEPKLLKCPCQTCGVMIEFPVHGVGQTITCPKCGLETVLFAPVPGRPTASIEQDGET